MKHTFFKILDTFGNILIDLAYFTTQVPDTSDATATLETRMRDECHTRLHLRHDCDNS